MRLIDGDILLEQFRTLRDKWGTESAKHRAVRGALVNCIHGLLPLLWRTNGR